MKKIYLGALAIGFIATGAIGQNLVSPYQFGQKNELSNAVEKITTPKDKFSKNITKALIWSEDFGGIGTSPIATGGPSFTTPNGIWTTGGANGNVWKHGFLSSNGTWSTNIPVLASTSAANGFMMFDADSVNTDWSLSPIDMVASPVGLTGELISPAIDLTLETSALLTFEQDYRYCCGNDALNINVYVSTNDGVTWSAPYQASKNEVTANDISQEDVGVLMSVNISNTAPGNTIKLKFAWETTANGDSHYYWAIDDISIVTLPPDDVINEASYIVGDGNEGQEYGRTPVSQIPASWTIGSSVKNFGANDQPAVTLEADFGSFVSNPAAILILADSTELIEEVASPSLPIGLYDGTYAVTAATDTVGEPTFVDNVRSRQFEITNSVYSLDGIGVYTSPLNSSIGTNSFTDATDGLILGTMYHIKADAVINNLQVMLATGTVAGGTIFGSIIDTTVFINDGTTPLFNADPVTVTAAHISAGFVDIPFAGGITLTPGAYFAAIELTSNSGSNHIVVMDDETVAQPGWASAIYIAADQSWTNGTAIGIRMVTTALSINENILDGVSVYPNPSKGMITISNDNNTTNTIAIYNVLGKEVFTTTANKSTSVDLSANGSGVYLVKISNTNGSTVERVVIK